MGVYSSGCRTRRDNDFPKSTQIIKGTQSDATLAESFIPGFEHDLIIKPDLDAAGGSIVFQFDRMPVVRPPRQNLRTHRRDGFAVCLIHHMQVQMHAIRRLAEMSVVELRITHTSEGDAEVVIAFVEDIEPGFAGECEGAPLRAAEPGQIERPADLRLVLRRLFQHERCRVAPALPFPGSRIFELPLITLLERMLRQQRTGRHEAQKLKVQGHTEGFKHRAVSNWRRFDRGTHPDCRSTSGWRRFRPHDGR